MTMSHPIGPVIAGSLGVLSALSVLAGLASQVGDPVPAEKLTTVDAIHIHLDTAGVPQFDDTLDPF